MQYRVVGPNPFVSIRIYVPECQYFITVPKRNFQAPDGRRSLRGGHIGDFPRSRELAPAPNDRVPL